MDQADDRDTIAEIEDAEIEAEVRRRISERLSVGGNVDPDAVARAFGRVIVWITEADTVAKAGFRAHVVAAKLNLGNTSGTTNTELAELMGFGRTAAHKLSKEFTRIFAIRGPNDRSEEISERCQQTYQRVQQDRAAGHRPQAILTADR